MIWSWKYGPPAGDEPVARAHARVAGQLAAADLQLRRDPAGRRRPVRVRRPGRAPRDLRRRRSPNPSRPTDSGVAHVLVIANETAASPTLLDTLRERARQGDVNVTVIAPVSEPRRGYVVYDDTRRASAGRRLEKTLSLLRDSSIRAQGFVVETEPGAGGEGRARPARAAAGRDHRLDPRRAAVGLAAPRRRRARSRVPRRGVPVRHVIADDEARRRPRRTCS